MSARLTDSLALSFGSSTGWLELGEQGKVGMHWGLGGEKVGSKLGSQDVVGPQWSGSGKGAES